MLYPTWSLSYFSTFSTNCDGKPISLTSLWWMYNPAVANSLCSLPSFEKELSSRSESSQLAIRSLISLLELVFESSEFAARRKRSITDLVCWIMESLTSSEPSLTLNFLKRSSCLNERELGLPDEYISWLPTLLLLANDEKLLSVRWPTFILEKLFLFPVRLVLPEVDIFRQVQNVNYLCAFRSRSRLLI